MKLNTQQAFRQVVFSKNCAKKVGLPASTISQYRKTLNDKKSRYKFTIDQMEKIIKAFGGVLIQESTWEI